MSPTARRRSAGSLPGAPKPRPVLLFPERTRAYRGHGCDTGIPRARSLNVSINWPVRARVVCGRQIDLQQHAMFGLETALGAQHGIEAAQQQSRRRPAMSSTTPPRRRPALAEPAAGAATRQRSRSPSRSAGHERSLRRLESRDQASRDAGEQPTTTVKRRTRRSTDSECQSRETGLRSVAEAIDDPVSRVQAPTLRRSRQGAMIRRPVGASTRVRLAPSAVRSATSRARPVACASSRLTRLTAAMSSRHPTAPIRTHSARRVVSLASHSLEGSLTRSKPLLMSGKRSPSRRATRDRSARACAV